MRHVWSDENRTRKVPRHRARAGHRPGPPRHHPAEAADEIVSNCDIDKIDMDKLAEQTERIGYPILGVVSQLNALCRDKLGEYCHWGATTQDITDTATVLQIREGAGDRRQRPGGDLRLRWPSSPGAIATRRSSAAATCSRRCRSPSATRWPASCAVERHRERLAAAAAARAGRRIRRRVRHAGVARNRRPWKRRPA